MMLRLCLLLSAFLFGSFLDAQSKAWFTHTTDSGKQESLADFMQASNVNGLSICVMTGLKTDTLIAVGTRNAATNAPVNAETKFLVGGMAGSLTNFLVLRAATLGMLKLDNPANDYLRSWKLPHRGRAVTVRDLLLHKRKFNLGYKPKGQEPGTAVPSTLQLLQGEAPAQNPPVKLLRRKNKGGESYYANFIVLQQLLEDLWGLSFEELAEREALEPLGMKNSLWKSTLTEADYANCAAGYAIGGEATPGMHRQYAELAHSGLWTTPADYARYAAHVFAASQGAPDALLSQDLARQAIQPQHAFRSLVFFKSTDLYWGGASPGYYTTFGGKAENGTVITVFTNSSLNWRFTNAILGMAWDYARAQVN